MSESPNIAIAEMPLTGEYASLIDDASRLLSSAVYEGSTSPEEIRNDIEKGRIVVAVDKTDGLIGAGLLRPTDPIDNHVAAAITELAVAPGHRGQGLGAEIIRQLEDIARADHFERLCISFTNNEALNLYERLGYRRPNADALFVQKSLGVTALHG